MSIVALSISCLHSVGNSTEETMAKPMEELPIDRYNREMKALWEKAKNVSELSVQDLIETLTEFSARVVGVCYNPKHKKDRDSEYSNDAGNSMLLKLKEELASRYRQFTAQGGDTLVAG